MTLTETACNSTPRSAGISLREPRHKSGRCAPSANRCTGPAAGSPRPWRSSPAASSWTPGRSPCGLSRSGVRTCTGPLRCPRSTGHLLDTAFGFRRAQKLTTGADKHLWGWSRQHGWKIIKVVVDAADTVDGPHKSPKGLRHGFTQPTWLNCRRGTSW